MRAAHSNQPVLGLELPLRGFIIVDQGKASGPSTTELCPETKGNDTVLLALVDAGNLLLKLSLGDVCARWVENVHHELAAGQETVGDELACPDGDGCLSVGLHGERTRSC